MGKNKSVVSYSSPAEEYFQREVLEVHKSDGIAEWVCFITVVIIFLWYLSSSSSALEQSSPALLFAL